MSRFLGNHIEEDLQIRRHRQKGVGPSSRRNESQVVIQQRMPEGDRDQLRPTMMTDQARHELLHAGLPARWSTDPRQDDRPAADHPYIQHKTLAMTMIYARIADKTVADEYFAVTEKVEALYGQPGQLASDDEGREMRKLRTEMHRRMLGNGYCARPVDMDCHFESICESCSFFVTTIEFRPTLQRQRDDAARKGQIGRQKVFDGLLNRLDTSAS